MGKYHGEWGFRAYSNARGVLSHSTHIDVGGLRYPPYNRNRTRRLGAVVAVNARGTDPVTYLKQEIGGAHGVLVTAASPKAFEQALGMVRRGGTIVLNGLPPGSFPLPIIDMVLDGITLRGSIVGTRLDLQEALAFAGEGAVKATVQTERLEDINGVFDRMRAGQIEGRVVLDFGN